MMMAWTEAATSSEGREKIQQKYQQDGVTS